MNIRLLPLGNLRSHPLNARIYGAAEPDQALIQSIEAVGVLNAIIIDNKARILSGTRRWKACKALAKRHRNRQFTEIPAEVFKGSELEAQRLLIHANRQREKTLEQKTREYREVLRLETELAKQRRIANLKKGSHAPEREIFPTRGRAAEIAAKATGLGFKTLGKFLKLVEKADEGDAEAKVLVDKVNRNGCRPTTAYDRVFRKIEMPRVGEFESELSTLFVELSSNLTSLTKLLKTSPTLSGKNRADSQAVVASLRKFSTEAAERTERLEEALRIAAIGRPKKLALCNVFPGAPLFKWLNKAHCGDCIALMDKMPAESIGLIVTSPPYNLRNSTGNGMKPR